MNSIDQKNQIFLEVLELYLAQLKADPCFEQARKSYAQFSDQRVYHLDDHGSPVQQLLNDAKAENAAYFKETAQAIQRSGVYVYHPGAGTKPGRVRADRFAESARQIILALKPPPSEPVVLSLNEGIKTGLAGGQKELVAGWLTAFRIEYQGYREECLRTGVKGYKEISLFTFVGFAGGLALGAVLDSLGASLSAIGEWAVRTISGEGESLAEGAWVLRKRMMRRKQSIAIQNSKEGDKEGGDEDLEGGFEEESEGDAAEAYGTGKVVGMAFPWAIDLGARLAGIDVRAPEGSFVAYFYSLADQLFANINGLRYHIRKAGSVWGGFKRYFQDPVMVSFFLIVTLPFAGIFLVRAQGWRPNTLVMVAVEGILLNLCWIPPLTAWVWDWHLQRGLRAVSDRYLERMNKL